MNVEPAWRTYLKVVIALIPTLFFWGFSLLIIFPRIQFVWDKAGFGDDGAQPPPAALRAFIGLSRLVFFNFNLIILAIAVSLIILELWVKPWNRLRKPTFTVAAILLNALLLLGLTVTIVTTLVAAEKIHRGQ